MSRETGSFFSHQIIREPVWFVFGFHILNDNFDWLQ
jgi:hypothetical protein